MARAYGLCPRLWLLVIVDSNKVALSDMNMNSLFYGKLKPGRDVIPNMKKKSAEHKARQCSELSCRCWKMAQEITKVREWIPHIGPLTKIIPLNSSLYNKYKQNLPYRMFIKISRQVFTVVWFIISRLKVFRMCFPGKKSSHWKPSKPEKN